MSDEQLASICIVSWLDVKDISFSCLSTCLTIDTFPWTNLRAGKTTGSYSVISKTISWIDVDALVWSREMQRWDRICHRRSIWEEKFLLLQTAKWSSYILASLTAFASVGLREGLPAPGMKARRRPLRPMRTHQVMLSYVLTNLAGCLPEERTVVSRWITITGVPV